MTDTLPEFLDDPQPRREDFRRWSNYAIARGSEALRRPMAAWCRRRAGYRPPEPPKNWRRGVFIGPAHIGDVLYNTAMLPALRAGLPACEWSFLVAGPSAQALRHNPHLHEVIVIRDGSRFRRRLHEAQPVLEARRFDVALTYAVGSSWQDLAIAALAGIPNRVGYVHKGFSGLVTHPVSIAYPQPFPAYFRDLVSQLTGQKPDPAASLRPLVYPGPEQEAAAAALAGAWGLETAAQPVLACAATSRQPFGIWPAERFLATVKRVRAAMPCAVVYFGAKSDAEALRQLAAQTGPGAHVVAGDLDLPAMVALLRRCTVALTPDSGSRHLANAAGIPVVFLRNLFNRRIETGVYCDTEHDLVPPEVELVPPARQAAEFAKIDPATVAEEIVRLLRERYSPR